MILICVGASEYGFDRLLKVIDELCQEGMIDGKDIIAQIGNSKYTPLHYSHFKLIDHHEFQQHLKNADFLITHAGTGSVVPPLKQGKKVIVFPRLAEYNEHLDNHQMELAELFSSQGYTLYADDKDSLCKALTHINSFQPQKFNSGNFHIQQIITNFLEGI